MCQILVNVFMAFRHSDVAFLAFWASCGSVLFIQQQGSVAPVSQLSTTIEDLPPSCACVPSLRMSPRSATVARVLPKSKSSSMPWSGIPSCASPEGSSWAAGPRQHARRTRIGLASATGLSALKPGSRVSVLTPGLGVYEERLCVWSISGDRWIMAFPDGFLTDVPIISWHCGTSRESEHIQGRLNRLTSSRFLSVMKNSLTGHVRDKRPPV